MIGNDIIDLRAAAIESRIHRKGFLEKLFLPAEISMIRNAAAPAVLTWLLWSCKEAVYKIVHRNTRERRYAPLRFMCRVSIPEIGLPSSYSGTVLYQQQAYYFRSNITTDFIHTHAAITPQLLSDAVVFTGQQLNSGYTALLHEILSTDEVFYKDEDGIPYILHHGDGRKQPVSVSHHGEHCGIMRIRNKRIDIFT
ncbi:4'-phosphopantetheinyl transferase superfamily protein [Chitinophaga sp. RCC_12]|uniref:4'-phosphopantetheinyl transferase family protein n=1 Tax=Chitinophaga sp. RCC_12 TaxID=3239226 RepID=UPI003524448B